MGRRTRLRRRLAAARPFQRAPSRPSLDAPPLRFFPHVSRRRALLRHSPACLPATRRVGVLFGQLAGIFGVQLTESHSKRAARPRIIPRCHVDAFRRSASRCRIAGRSASRRWIAGGAPPDAGLGHGVVGRERRPGFVPGGLFVASARYFIAPPWQNGHNGMRYISWGREERWRTQL